MKNKKDVLFINIIPTDERQEDSSYPEHVLDYVKKIKKDFFSYSLITMGHNRLDPWVLAQALMSASSDFNPLIAVNPYYQHPLQIIKKLSTLQQFYPNRVALNLIPGSFEKEMKALNELSTFEEKQHRLHEFSSVIKGYIENKNEFSFSGESYQLSSARIYPALEDKDIKVFFSGMGQSRRAGNEKTYFVQNIRPFEEMLPAAQPHLGLSLGVCARRSSEEAQEALQRLYPDNRQGRMLFEMAVNNDTTPWNVWIKKRLEDNKSDGADFNLRPMKNFWSPAPFIVGSYDQVAAQLNKYVELGYEFFILDFYPEDFEHIEESIKKFRLKI